MAPTNTAPTEKELREELALVYRLVDYYGMTDLIFNHISLMVPAEDSNEKNFLINPYGFLFNEITASSLVKIDINGEPVEETDYEVNPAGFVIHAAVHKARSDAKCVLHTHTRAGMAVSALKVGLLWLNQMSLSFYQRVGYHDYPGVALDLAEQDSLQRDIGLYNALILRNHGLLTVGETATDALLAMIRLDKACQLQLDAMAAGELIQPPLEILERTGNQLNGRFDDNDLPDKHVLALFRDAMFRLGDRKFPDYKN
jgi:ribulose-5-phosphate 4-epimerase/fuculose-1-phosphate aldolase